MQYMSKKNNIIFSIIAILIVSLIVGCVFLLPPGGNAPIDTTAPTVEIISPTSTTYNNASLLLEINATDDTAIDAIWFNWEGTNETYTASHLIEFDEGSNTLHAWANDSEGNVGTDSVTFTIHTTTSSATTKITIHSITP